MTSDPQAASRSLAVEIANCPELARISRGESSGCSRVANWQTETFVKLGMSPTEAEKARHLPEPWAGALSTAQIMFLSSNPSFDPDERYPDGSWDTAAVADFMADRFVLNASRGFGALDGPTERDQDRTILKAGQNTALSRRVRTWQVLRRRAALILDKPVSETLASQHYVMTEVVHCKSQREAGVAEALPTCVDRWLMKIFAACAARLVIVSGQQAGEAVKAAISQITGRDMPTHWGSWAGPNPATGRWPSSNAELADWAANGQWTEADQGAHTADVTIPLNGSDTAYTFVWLPHPVRSVPQQLSDPSLIAPPLLRKWRNLTR